jgi:peptidoglycan biosynthesis protein MviN/MurJ (putative lipid II flippase)
MVWAPIFVFTIHVFLSLGLHIYILLPWMDIPMHYLGGLSIAYSLFLLLIFLKERGIITHLDRVIELTFVFTLVATIAVFWEFSEFSMDQLLGTNVQISLQNTMQDLFMGIVGASTMIGYKIIKKPK